MAYSATFAAQQSSIRAQSTANQGIRRSSKRRASVPRAQKPQQSEEAGAVVFTTDSLSNSVGAAVIEKPETKTPSPSINVIPVSRWPEGIPPAMGGHYMVSGAAAPLSQSKGPGVDIAPLYFTYPAGEGNVDVTIYENDFSAATGLADTVAAASAAAIAAKGAFTIALSGGSLIKALKGLVGRTDVDFTKWWVVFVDERVVPLSSPDSNFRGASEDFLRKVPVPTSQVLAIKEGLPAAQAAEHYAGQLLDLGADVLPRTPAGFPVLDLVLLGVGPDGHVASLFPNRKETAAISGWVLPVTDSPKPPAERITFTMPVLNAAKQVAVVALGGGKAEVVHRALEVQSLPGALPVQLVRPQSGRVSWVLDQGAASSLAIQDWGNFKKYPRSDLRA